MPDERFELESRIYPLWVVFKPAEDIAGHWVGHCLSLDVVTSGTSLAHAMGMLVDAVGMTLEEDLDQGRDPHARKAPQNFWDDLSRIIKEGRPVTMGEVLSPRKNEHWKALAQQIMFRLDRSRQVEGQEFSSPVAEPDEVALA